MKKPTKWKTTCSSYIHQHPYMSVRKLTRTAPGFAEHDFFVLDFPDWANVVAVTDDGMAVLVRQYRHGIDDFNLEIPGGVVDAGEDAATAAVRELVEETGYVAKKIELLAKVSVNPAIQDNWCHLFLATGCRLEQQQELDGTESIAVELVPFAQLQQLLDKGKIHHSLNYLAITLALSKSAE